MTKKAENFFQSIQTKKSYNSQNLIEFKKLYKKNVKETQNALRDLIISINILLSEDPKILRSKNISTLLSFFQQISRDDWTPNQSLKLLFFKTLENQTIRQEFHPQERSAALSLLTQFYRRKGINLAKKLLESDPCIVIRVKSQELIFSHISLLEKMILRETKKEEEKNEKRKRTERETGNRSKHYQGVQKEKKKEKGLIKRNNINKNNNTQIIKKKTTLNIESEEIKIPSLIEKDGLILMETDKSHTDKGGNEAKECDEKMDQKKLKMMKRVGEIEKGAQDQKKKEDSEIEIHKEKSTPLSLKNNSNENDSNSSTVLYDNIRIERSLFINKALLSRKKLINYLTQNLNLDPLAVVRREIIGKFQKYLKSRSKKSHYSEFFESFCEEFAPTLLLKTRDRDKRVRICAFLILKRLLRKKKRLFYRLYPEEQLAPVLIFAFLSNNSVLKSIAEKILQKLLKPKKDQLNIPLGFHVCKILSRLNFVDNYEPFREILKKNVKRYFHTPNFSEGESDVSLIPEEI
ncbi:hypothetical protein M0812_15589 [Anaeramoeba flamelloides]|uniref:Protein SDA1 n=1 Tax=Anaeramoeba flamelloides TaxID=1746091 RepID=A0AAV7ZC12_9EUKA|nr:hypothetical protein M0812_15589 [Anaeramoeba flamelloides]